MGLKLSHEFLMEIYENISQCNRSSAFMVQYTQEYPYLSLLLVIINRLVEQKIPLQIWFLKLFHALLFVNQACLKFAIFFTQFMLNRCLKFIPKKLYWLLIHSLQCTLNPLNSILNYPKTVFPSTIFWASLHLGALTKPSSILSSRPESVGRNMYGKSYKTDFYDSVVQ